MCARTELNACFPELIQIHNSWKCACKAPNVDTGSSSELRNNHPLCTYAAL